MKGLLTICFLLVSTISFAKIQCKVEITNTKFSGEKIRVIFHSQLDTKRECATLAKMHEKNFDPNQVRSKEVRYQWGGRSEVAARENYGRKRFR